MRPREQTTHHWVSQTCLSRERRCRLQSTLRVPPAYLPYHTVHLLAPCLSGVHMYSTRTLMHPDLRGPALSSQIRLSPRSAKQEGKGHGDAPRFARRCNCKLQLQLHCYSTYLTLLSFLLLR